MTQSLLTKPNWLKVKIPAGEKYQFISDKSKNLKLATVCTEARCPNIGECWSSGTATFMIMGDTCTRACRFCNVKTGKKPKALDVNEPANLAATINELNLKYVVLTSVDRDELIDQGANHVYQCINAVKSQCPNTLIEMLMPDFRGEAALLDIVCNSNAEVLAHNIETVNRLTKLVRDKRAGYQQSLNVLTYIKKNYPHFYTKSSIMVGLGESDAEVYQTMVDLRKSQVDFLTIGQYLQPNSSLLSVKDYIHPDQFKIYEQQALALGFKYAASGPLVRSSYKAAEYFITNVLYNEKKT